MANYTDIVHARDIALVIDGKPKWGSVLTTASEGPDRPFITGQDWSVTLEATIDKSLFYSDRNNWPEWTNRPVTVKWKGARWFSPTVRFEGAKAKSFVQDILPDSTVVEFNITADGYGVEWSHWCACPVYWLWQTWVKVHKWVRRKANRWLIIQTSYRYEIQSYS